MKYKVYSSKFMSFFSVAGIILFAIIEIVNICLLFNGIIKNNDVLFEIIMIIAFLPFIIFMMFMGNRFGYIVTYDCEGGLLYRRGLFFGYKYKVRTNDIQDIIIATFPKETTYYILIDSANTKYDGGYKNSFIRIEKNDVNLNFIKQFWDKPIK